MIKIFFISLSIISMLFSDKIDNAVVLLQTSEFYKGMSKKEIKKEIVEKVLNAMPKDLDPKYFVAFLPPNEDSYRKDYDDYLKEINKYIDTQVEIFNRVNQNIGSVENSIAIVKMIEQAYLDYDAKTIADSIFLKQFLSSILLKSLIKQQNIEAVNTILIGFNEIDNLYSTNRKAVDSLLNSDKNISADLIISSVIIFSDLESKFEKDIFTKNIDKFSNNYSFGFILLKQLYDNYYFKWINNNPNDAKSSVLSQYKAIAILETACCQNPSIIQLVAQKQPINATLKSMINKTPEEIIAGKTKIETYTEYGFNAVDIVSYASLLFGVGAGAVAIKSVGKHALKKFAKNKFENSVKDEANNVVTEQVKQGATKQVTENTKKYLKEFAKEFAKYKTEHIVLNNINMLEERIQVIIQANNICKLNFIVSNNIDMFEERIKAVLEANNMGELNFIVSFLLKNVLEQEINLHMDQGFDKALEQANNMKSLITRGGLITQIKSAK